jgi:hypothetical protein
MIINLVTGTKLSIYYHTLFSITRGGAYNNPCFIDGARKVKEHAPRLPCWDSERINRICTFYASNGTFKHWDPGIL